MDGSQLDTVEWKRACSLDISSIGVDMPAYHVKGKKIPSDLPLTDCEKFSNIKRVVLRR